MMEKKGLSLIIIILLGFLFPLTVLPVQQAHADAETHTVVLHCTGYSAALNEWSTLTGSSPYLDTYDEGTNCISNNLRTSLPRDIQYFTFEELPAGAVNITAVTFLFNFYMSGVVYSTVTFKPYNYSNDQWVDLGVSWTKLNEYGNATKNLSGFIPFTVTEVNRLRIEFSQVELAVSCATYVTYAEVQVTYTTTDVTLSADELENIDSGANWVFTDWKYYEFTLDVPNTELQNTTEAAIKFTVPVAGVGDVEVGFDSNGTDWVYESSLTDADSTRYGEPVLLKAGEWVNAGDHFNVTFYIFFTGRCLDVYDDAVDVYCWLNFTSFPEIDWFKVSEGFFFIYSKGGFSKDFATTNVNLANKVQGKEWAAIYAYNGTSCQNTIWFRDLQHIKMLPEVQCYAGYETFYLRTAVEYSLGDGHWYPGWLCNINPVFVSYTGVFAGQVWINMTINFARGTGEDETHSEADRYTWVTSNPVYMFYHGSVSTAGDIARFRFWNDQWFNNINASSTGGGRINAYEYPVQDNADLWLRWLANNWGVKDNVFKESQALFDLTGAGGEIISASQIKMVRVVTNLTVADQNAGQFVLIENFDVMDYTKSRELPLTGIQTPVFDETKMPTVGNTGVLGAIWSMFAGIGQWLGENVVFGGLNLWGNFVNFLDTIAGWLGAPKFFTNLFAWIGSGFSYLGSGVLYLLQIMYDIFLLFGSLLATFITTMGQLIASLLNTLTYFVNIMGGVWGGAGNLWDQLGISNWLIVAMVFYPIYLIILWEEQGLDAVISQLTMIFGILSWLAHFFIQVGQFIINMIHSLIESIPVVE